MKVSRTGESLASFSATTSGLLSTKPQKANVPASDRDARGKAL